MGLRRVGLAVVCLLALIADAASAARGFPGKDVDLAKKSWTEVMISNFALMPSFVEVYVGISTDAIMEDKLLSDDNFQNAISVLPSETKHNIFNCLRKRHLVVLKNSGNSERRLGQYSGLFLSHDAPCRRHLTDSSSEVSSSFRHEPSIAPTSLLNIAQNPFMDVVSTPSAVLASARAPNAAFVPAHIPIRFKKLALTSRSLPSAAPVTSPFPVGIPHSISPMPHLSPRIGDDVDRSSFGSANYTSKRHNDTREIVIAVIITGTVSFSLSGIFFYCYIRCCRTSKSENGKSERPLLSLSDFSDGSSRKSFAIGNTLHCDKVGALPLKVDENRNGHVSFFDLDDASMENLSHEAISENYKISVDQPSTLDACTVPTPPPPPPPPKKQTSSKMVPSPPAPPLAPMISPHSPPPPLHGVLPPQPPPPMRRLSPLGPNRSKDAASETTMLGSRTKLKPFFWDKVMANPDQSMVWHQIKSGSFQFNEEMIETLFRYNVTDNHKSEDKKGHVTTGQLFQIIDSKKSQNLAILLRALNVGMEDVCLALTDGNELPRELIQTLIKMPPTAEEELKLRLYDGDISQLHTAERLLKALLDIPFAYKRLETLLFMCSFQEDLATIKESFKTIKAACGELRSSRLFLKLLEAVLKTGNRMNDGTYRGGAQAFKLDTLLKLSDVKGTDGKTTLLHFVVQEIIRTEGIRAARAARDHSGSSMKSVGCKDDSLFNVGNPYNSLGLKVVSGLDSELGNVKKAAALDADVLTSMVTNLGRGMIRAKEFLENDMNSTDGTSGFQQSLEWFVEHAEGDVVSLLEEEKTMRALVKSTTDYFHGHAGKDEGLRLFVIVRNFLGMLEKVCNEIRQAASTEEQKVALLSKEVLVSQPVSDPWHPLFPAIQKYRLDMSSSDEDSP